MRKLLFWLLSFTYSLTLFALAHATESIDPEEELYEMLCEKRVATSTPKMHDSFWPDFCIYHLLHNPEGCSEWDEDEDGNLDLAFLLKRSSECYIDKKLLERLGDLVQLIPENSEGYRGACDYAWCPRCSNSVAHGFYYQKEFDYLDESDDEDDEPSYSYRCIPVYQCACTEGRWLDQDEVEEELSYSDYDEDCDDDDEYYYESSHNYYADAYLNWRFCKAPTIHYNYIDWHHQSYFQG